MPAVTRKKSVRPSTTSQPLPQAMPTAPVASQPKRNPLKVLGKFAPKGYMPVLIGLLLIASFFLGMLVDKVQYLQSGQAQGLGYAPSGAQGQQAPGAQPPAQKQNVTLGHFPALGNKDAKVTIIEFADLRCPFCERFFTDTEQQLMKNYVDTGKAKFVFRQYAFLGPASTTAANAAECANDQGKFWEFHDYMYKNQPSESDTSMYTTDKLTEIAGTLGMNTDQFQSCLSTNKDADKASADLTEGQKVGVTGTPTIFINGTPVVGAQPYATFQQLIDQELAKK